MTPERVGDLNGELQRLVERELLTRPKPRLARAPLLGEQDLWIWDFARTTLTRLTFDKGDDESPVWTRDGSRVFFSSERAGIRNLYVQAADGAGEAIRMAESPNVQIPTDITSDGKRVIFRELTSSGQGDLRLLTLTPTPHVEPLLTTPYDERAAVLSPDGRWLAYQSNSSGRVEIYVRPFPGLAGQWQISNSGGQEPLWSRSGKELFYRTPDGVLTVVPVDPSGASWSAGTSTKLVDGHYYTGFGGGNGSRQYDVSPD